MGSMDDKEYLRVIVRGDVVRMVEEPGGYRVEVIAKRKYRDDAHAVLERLVDWLSQWGGR